MNLDNVYSFTVQRQNSSEVLPGKSPCVKIKFIKDESIKNSPKPKLGLDDVSELTSISDEDKIDIIQDDASGSSPLSICPIYNRDINCPENLGSVFIEMHKMVEKKDNHLIFAYPVTEIQAPNYRNIIDNPMDMQTIRLNIDSGIYLCIVDMVEDVILMCQNALIYNTSDTVYYKISSQMLNYVKKIFSKETLNKFIINKLNWTRCLTEEEFGDWPTCLDRIKLIQNEVAKNITSARPHRALQKNIQQDVVNNKRKNQSNLQTLLAKKANMQTFIENVARSERSESENEDNGSIINLSEDDIDDEEEIDDDSDDIDDILLTAQQASKAAKERLEKSHPHTVVRLDKSGETISLVDFYSNQIYSLDKEYQSMVNSISSVNVEQMLGENDRILAQLGQLCYDTNEVVTLTTSKPLESYSCAEQAVLVETFGDVVTAEFACNMHNFVLELPHNSPALEIVKNKLNTATNYLTYGVDQIIIKKLKAAADTSRY